MKKLKSAISMVLALALLLSVTYIPAMAAGATEPSIAIEARKLTAEERDSFGVSDEDLYGLFFTGNGGTDEEGTALGISLASVVISYDNEVIQPYNKRTGATISEPNAQSFVIPDEAEDGYSTPGVAAATDGTTTTFEYGVSAIPDNIYSTGELLLYVMLFKVKDNDEGLMNARTFRVELDADRLDSVQASTSVTMNTVSVGDNGGVSAGAYYYGAKVEGSTALSKAPSLTYPNSDVLVPLSTPTVTLSTVSGGQGGLNITVNDSANGDLVEEYIVKLYDGDSLVKTVTISGSTTTAAVADADGITAGTAYTATVEAVATAAATADGYGNSAVSGKSNAVEAGKGTPVATTVEVTVDEDTLVVPAATGEVKATASAAVKDQYGDLMDGESVIWSISPAVGTGVTFADGVLTVNQDAKASISDTTGVTYTITATDGSKSGSATVTVCRAEPVYTVTISGGTAKLEVPANDTPAETTYTASITDQYGENCDSVGVDWSVSPEVAGISIDDSGKLTVTKDAAQAIADTTGQELTVTAQVKGSDAQKTASITVARAASVASSVEIVGDATVVIPVSGGDNEYTYTATVKDQYGVTMDGRTINWTNDNALSGVAVTDNVTDKKVTVSVGAATGSFKLTATDSQVPGATADLSIQVVAVSVDWDAVDAQITGTSYTYGDRNDKAGALGTGTASVGAGTTLNGTFSYADAEGVQGAGTKTITVKFTVTSDGEYKDLVLTHDVPVEIAKKTLSVEWGNTDLTYNGKAQAPSATASTGIDGQEVTLTVSGSETNAGSGYTATAALATGSENFALDAETATCTFAIAAKKIAVVWSNTELSYTGKEQAPTATATTGIDGETVTLTVTGGESAVGKNYTATAAIEPANSNYELTNATTSFVINPATVSITTDLSALNKTIYANDTNNKDAEALLAMMQPPATVKVSAPGMDESDAAITWAAATPAFNQKGATYTYVGTLNADRNYANRPEAQVTLTVKAVTLESIATVPAALTVAKSAVNDLTDSLAPLGLPENVDLSYDYASANGTVAAQWNKTVADLKAAANRVTAEQNQTVEITLSAEVIPGWATFELSQLPTVKVTITNSFPVNVSFTTPVEDITYGETLATPVAEATDAGNGLGASTEMKYYYEGTGSTVYARSETAPKDAGTYKCVAVYANDTHYGEAECEFTIAPKQVTLNWTGDLNTTYDKTLKTVAAEVSNLEADDTCTVTVKDNTATNAGSYVAEAVSLSNPNYVLPTSAVDRQKTFVIERADRNVAITSADVVLAPGKLSTYLTYTCDDLDQSAAANAGWTSGDSSLAVISTAGKVTAVSNGKVAMTITIAESTNYKAGTASIDVISLPQPITGVTATADGGDLTATVSGTTITITGSMPEGAVLSVTPATASVDGATVTAAPADLDKNTLTVTVNGTDITYSIERSGIVEIPAHVTVEEGAAVVDTGESGATITSASTDGLDVAVPQSILNTAADKLTDEQIAEGYEAQVEVYAKVTVTSYDADTKAMSLTVTPYYTISAVKRGSPEVELQGETQLSSLNRSVKVTVNTSETYTFARIVSGGRTYYLPITANAFETTVFGTFQLVQTADKSITVNYTYADGRTQTLTYSAADIGTALPVDDSKSGFTGWTLSKDGSAVNSTKYTVFTEELFNLLNADTYAAESTFTSGGGGGGGGGSVTTKYTITASAGAGGSISPSGKVSVTSGKDQTFKITPNAGYAVADVVVDGKSVGRVSSYTFENVTKTHTISVTFTKSSDVSVVFTDVSADDWFYDAVQYVYDAGMMNGTSATTFSPNGTITRGMIVTMLYRLEGEPNVTITGKFGDITPATWCAEAVSWAAANGVVNGYENGLFGKDDPITREQLAAILYRYADLKGYDISDSADLSSFSDTASVSKYAVPALEWACGAGIVKGNDGRLLPKSTGSRAEAAVMLMRFMETCAK